MILGDLGHADDNIRVSNAYRNDDNVPKLAAACALSAGTFELQISNYLSKQASHAKMVACPLNDELLYSARSTIAQHESSDTYSNQNVSW